MKTKIKIERGDVIRLVLGVVAVAGVVTTAAVCPGLLKVVVDATRGSYPRTSLKRAIHRLDKKGWFLAIEEGRSIKIVLSKKGRAAWMEYEMGTRKIAKPRKWDQRWRLLIFDIPEAKKFLREKIRRVLQQWEFVRLQDSVWIYPYECSDILALLRTKYGVRSEALALTVDRFDNDRWLCREFSLEG
ncbi:MAG: hypothetical protein Q8R07_04680 [Candidatus Uhrbacteria bacterium]|nr:hypothetical protein [Candidatus Uhrbacteria bacterium]